MLEVLIHASQHLLAVSGVVQSSRVEGRAYLVANILHQGVATEAILLEQFDLVSLIHGSLLPQLSSISVLHNSVRISLYERTALQVLDSTI